MKSVDEYAYVIKETLSFLDLCDFKLVVDQGKFGLQDLQGGNLGDIESDRFDNLLEMVSRMDIYKNDCVTADVDERIENGENVPYDDPVLRSMLFLESEKCMDILERVSCTEYEEYVSSDYCTEDGEPFLIPIGKLTTNVKGCLIKRNTSYYYNVEDFERALKNAKADGLIIYNVYDRTKEAVSRCIMKGDN